jgi:2-phosphosulfolactate phosphatase
VPALHLHTLPQDVAPTKLAGATVIIVDQLRASTTIATALAAGAECVMPFAEIEETLAAAVRLGRANVLLGGERGGKLIPGFDLGNSPAEYTPERVAGRRILFTTTNGARALHHARGARRILVGAAVNCTAVALAVAPGADVAILCAGTDGVIAFEDRLAGGAFVEALTRRGATWTFNEPATAALDRWRRVGDEARARSIPLANVFVERMTETDGGQNLIAIGQEADLARCARLDSLDVAPELDQGANELRARHSR